MVYFKPKILLPSKVSHYTVIGIGSMGVLKKYIYSAHFFVL